MDSKSIRYKNTRYLVDIAGGVSNFGEKIGKSQSQTSQFAGSTPIKGIGNKIAREIEAAFKKDHGWLDVAHPDLWESINSQTQQQFQSDQSQSQSQGIPRQQDIRDLPVRHDGLPPSKQTPVISWVSAGDYTEVLSGDLSRVIEWIPYNPKAGKYGFALIVDGVSMEPKFMPDDRIYVNPTFQIDELHTGDLVIMACDGDEKATFKELVVEDGNYYLRPLNPNWQPRLMPVNEHCRLVGKVVGRFNDFD